MLQNRRKFIKNILCSSLASTIISPPLLIDNNRLFKQKTSRQIRICFFTDIHTRAEWKTPKALEKTAETITETKADFIICGGDMITDGFQNNKKIATPRWDIYMQKLHQQVHTEIHPAMGNHDYVGAYSHYGKKLNKYPKNEFKSRMKIDSIYRFFDAIGFRFIFLESIHVSNDDKIYHCKIDDEQKIWLTELLKKTKNSQPIILITHAPLLSLYYNALQGNTKSPPINRVISNNSEIIKLFDNHNLLLVLQGHLHVFEKMLWRNTTFITGGAVCAKWWRGAWHGTEEGFVIIDINRNNSNIENIQYINYGWKAKRPISQ